ncbi:MAG: universal stress protein [Thermodesulfobacteriota bacterium]|nr:universal stress protein [Thermodesulfobacteriota bacterium]
MMGKVLLAIDGMQPDRQIFGYAVDFCRRIKAELNILHIIDPDVARGRLTRLKKQARLARNYLEKTMMAAAFAETGEHETAKELMDEAAANIRRLLAEKNEQNVQYRVKVRSGDVHREIETYVNQHRDVVLAIYDDTIPSTGDEQSGETERPALQRHSRQKHRANVSNLKKRLSVPLVARRVETQ